MTSRRTERLNEQFRRELMDILRHELRDPRVGSVTVTQVEVSANLYHARVYLTTLTPDAEREPMLEGLRAARPFIRRELGRRLHIRRVPEIDFEWDSTLDRARRIEKLLAEVRPDEGPGPPEPDEPPVDE